MTRIKILTNCQAAGAHQVAGAVLTVPVAIDAAEADALVRIGRARYLDQAPAQPVVEAEAVTETVEETASPAEETEQKPTLPAKPRKKADRS